MARNNGISNWSESYGVVSGSRDEFRESPGEIQWCLWGGGIHHIYCIWCRQELRLDGVAIGVGRSKKYRPCRFGHSAEPVQEDGIHPQPTSILGRYQRGENARAIQRTPVPNHPRKRKVASRSVLEPTAYRDMGLPRSCGG